ncbi:rhomboid-like protein [Streptomyces purpureus]|uniref:Uncharacterized protein n=1 Tax=Streptomyces purpureus TaxID=1951 RepID=A0A918H4P7_9ACTN|nr:rhomboid-like protein [Streptomyces purpureus]GGT33019.1 hypothetical protein GCM10014713_28170 [Streptomyces purpureus]
MRRRRTPPDPSGPAGLLDALPQRPAPPAGTVMRGRVPVPFTFAYGGVLLATSLYAEFGDPGTVAALLEGSSTDAAHLARTPLLVLVASALWIAGGLASPYALGFVVVLAALERRVGAVRTAAVFGAGHVVATLATEVPVGISVWAGQLPVSSLHRLDYGISFGLLACTGALALLLRAPLRAALLAGVSLMLLADLRAYEDPVSDWGHLLAFVTGLMCWSVVRPGAGRRTPAEGRRDAPRRPRRRPGGRAR